jgi:anaerobic selenocysteine-containing dehydrogenase
MNTAIKTHFRTCNLCEAMCGIEIQYQGNEVLTIKGDKNDPFSRGHICPKAMGLKDIYEDPDRLKMPVKRTDNGWVKISWEEAFNEVVTNIKKIQQKYNDSNVVGVYQGNPNAHNTGSILTGPHFVRSLKTKNRFSATSVDQLPHHFASFFMLGHQLLLPIPDIDRTNFWLILGANPLVSNGSLMTAPDVAHRLQAIQQRGGKVVVVDPRRTETAQKASEHHFITPGTDALFLLALIHTIYEEKLIKPERLQSFTDGFEVIENLVKNFSPESVEKLVKIPAQTIRTIAREFAQADKGVVYGRMGVSTQEFGAICLWLVYVLNIITGNFDREGGMMFTLPAIDMVGLTGMRGAVGGFGRWRSRVRNLPEFGGELPVSALAEEILTPGQGQIKALVTIAGNPVLSTPNGTQLEQALDKLEYMVAIDIYINETTRFANIILPPTTGLENNHYDIIFHYLAIRNTAKYSPKLFESPKNSMPDWLIFRELANRMNNLDNSQTKKLEKEKDPTLRLSMEGMLDLALRFGPYGSRGSKFYKAKPYQGLGLSLQMLREKPHGIDISPLIPCLPHRLFTKDKRINLAPEILVKDIDRLKEKMSQLAQSIDDGFNYLLIGRRHLRSNNSWMHNSYRLVKGKNRCTLLMNPLDAQKLDLVSGQLIEVSSRVGKILIELEISSEIMPGVVSIPHGWGHNRQGVNWKIAQQNAGTSINDLTDELFLDQLSGNNALSGVSVRINK